MCAKYARYLFDEIMPLLDNLINVVFAWIFFLRRCSLHEDWNSIVFILIIVYLAFQLDLMETSISSVLDWDVHCMLIWSLIIFSLIGIHLVSDLNFCEQPIHLSCFLKNRGILCDLIESLNERNFAWKLFTHSVMLSLILYFVWFLAFIWVGNKIHHFVSQFFKISRFLSSFH